VIYMASIRELAERYIDRLCRLLDIDREKIVLRVRRKMVERARFVRKNNHYEVEIKRSIDKKSLPACIFHELVHILTVDNLSFRIKPFLDGCPRHTHRLLIRILERAQYVVIEIIFPIWLYQNTNNITIRKYIVNTLRFYYRKLPQDKYAIYADVLRDPFRAVVLAYLYYGLTKTAEKLGCTDLRRSFARCSRIYSRALVLSDTRYKKWRRGVKIERPLSRGYISRLLYRTIEHVCIPIYEKHLKSMLGSRRVYFDVDEARDAFYVEFCCA